MTTTATLPVKITLGEVAMLGRCSERTVRNWFLLGRIPMPVRVGRRLLFDRDGVLAALGIALPVARVARPA